MINFNLLEFILYAKNHNFVIMTFESKIFNLNNFDLRSLNDFCLSLKLKNFRILFEKEKKINNRIDIRFANNQILYIEYIYYVNNYRLYGFYNSNYNSDNSSSIQKENMTSESAFIFYDDENFYSIEELLKIKDNLIFL